METKNQKLVALVVAIIAKKLHITMRVVKQRNE